MLPLAHTDCSKHLQWSHIFYILSAIRLWDLIRATRCNGQNILTYYQHRCMIWVIIPVFMCLFRCQCVSVLQSEPYTLQSTIRTFNIWFLRMDQTRRWIAISFRIDLAVLVLVVEIRQSDHDTARTDKCSLLQHSVYIPCMCITC
jgi:hypothetical protein